MKHQDPIRKHFKNIYLKVFGKWQIDTSEHCVLKLPEIFGSSGDYNQIQCSQKVMKVSHTHPPKEREKKGGKGNQLLMLAKHFVFAG